jgi:hypothetical protein
MKASSSAAAGHSSLMTIEHPLVEEDGGWGRGKGGWGLSHGLMITAIKNIISKNLNLHASTLV